jgi:hypothetical protein
LEHQWRYEMERSEVWVKVVRQEEMKPAPVRSL